MERMRGDLKVKMTKWLKNKDQNSFNKKKVCFATIMCFKPLIY